MRLRYGGRNDMVTSSSDYGYSSQGRDGQNVRTTFSYPMYQQFLADNQTMTDLFACAPFGRVNVVVDGQAEIATAFISSGNYYQVLGVSARIGRTIVPDDDTPTAPPVAVISSKYWHTRFCDRSRGRRQDHPRQQRRRSRSSASCRRSSPACSSRLRKPPDISLPLALDPQLDTSLPPPSGPPQPRASPSRPTGGCRSWDG